MSAVANSALLLLLATALFLAALFLDMSKEWAIKIKTVDMEEKPLAEGEKTMVDFSTDTAKEAMLANAYEQDVASYIKNAFDKKYGCARAIAAAIAAARASRRATAAATRATAAHTRIPRRRRPPLLFAAAPGTSSSARTTRRTSCTRRSTSSSSTLGRRPS